MSFINQPFLSRRSDELYHHGILGQKWGVRRFQNPDGTLTAEGKARYLSPKEQKKFAKEATYDKAFRSYAGKSKNFKSLMKSPQVQEAARELNDVVKEAHYAKIDRSKKLDRVYEYLDNHPDEKNKWAEKVIDKWLKKYGDRTTKREELLEAFYEGNLFDEADFSPIELFMKDNSNKKIVREFREAEKKSINLGKAAYQQVKEYADKFLGEYKDKPVKNVINYNWLGTVLASDRVATAIVREIIDNI